MAALQQALKSAQQDAMARSQETLLVQETNAVAQKHLTSSLHLSLESLLDSDMDRVYRGMQRFDAAMVWQSWTYFLLYTASTNILSLFVGMVDQPNEHDS